MSAHTPGPWVVYVPFGEISERRYGINGPDGEAVVWHGEPGSDNGIECHDDAHLIASSPRLLAALDGLCEATQHLYRAGRIPAGVWFEARAASRKARGLGIADALITDSGSTAERGQESADTDARDD